MIFLFNFTIKGDGIDFELNEGIAKDMYADLDLQLKPIVEDMAQMLMPYKYFSKNDKIMTAHILDTNELEVLFSQGLGQVINIYEKNLLFANAKKVTDILIQVMNRHTLESKKL